MKKLIALAALAVATTGCQYGYHGSSWAPAPDATSYGVWTHDSTDNGCNEWDSEPTAEVDLDGNLCESFVP